MDAESFQTHYAACVPALAAWASVRIRGPLRRELSPGDVVQEVACRAYARRASFDTSRGNFRAWLFGIARNVLLRALEDMATSKASHQSDWLSTQGLHRVPDDATSVTQAALRNERLAGFEQRTDELDEEDRTLLVRRGLEGASFAEVAETLGIDAKAATKRWERLRAKLHESWTALDLTE